MFDRFIPDDDSFEQSPDATEAVENYDTSGDAVQDDTGQPDLEPDATVDDEAAITAPGHWTAEADSEPADEETPRRAGALAIGASEEAEADEQPPEHVAPVMPDSPKTRTSRSRGQVPHALSVAQAALQRDGRDISELIPEKATRIREHAHLLVNSELSDAQIAEMTGLRKGNVSSMRQRLLNTVEAQTSGAVAAGIKAALGIGFEHAAATGDTAAPEADAGQHAGRQIGQYIKALGLTGTEMSKLTGIAQSRISRLMTGATRPDADEVIVPLMEVLKSRGLPPEWADDLIQRYRNQAGN